MNIYYEFHKVAQRLAEQHTEYALAGGVAMAFHARPRFTKDIDLLIKKTALAATIAALEKEGYTQSAPPWSFSQAPLSLHRYLKNEDEDDMIMDVLVAESPEIEQMIDQADIAESEAMGPIPVLSKKDLVRLKKMRNSAQDQADIEVLERD